MNPDEFESRLRRTPLKRPPEEWRHEILSTADAHRHTSRSHEQIIIRRATAPKTFAATWRTRVRELFWPHPVAWGAITALWLVIGAVHLVLREPGQPTRSADIAASPGVPTLMSMQRELLASADESADRPKAAPHRAIPPQSSIVRRNEFEVV